MIRVRVFSAVYGGIGRVKRHHSGVVGNVLGKEMGKEFLVPFFLHYPSKSCFASAPVYVKDALRRTLDIDLNLNRVEGRRYYLPPL